MEILTGASKKGWSDNSTLLKDVDKNKLMELINTIKMCSDCDEVKLVGNNKTFEKLMKNDFPLGDFEREDITDFLDESRLYVIPTEKLDEYDDHVWFDTIDKGINYGCRPCKHCMPNIATIPSGSILTKKQTDIIYEFAMVPIPVEEFKKLGYTDEEAQKLSEASVIYK